MGTLQFMYQPRGWALGGFQFRAISIAMNIPERVLVKTWVSFCGVYTQERLACRSDMYAQI